MINMTMQEVIKKNHKEAYKRYIEEKEERNRLEKAEQRKNKVITIAAATLIIGLVCYYICTVNQITSKAMNNCMKNHSEDYCARKLG